MKSPSFFRTLQKENFIGEKAGMSIHGEARNGIPCGKREGMEGWVFG